LQLLQCTDVTHTQLCKVQIQQMRGQAGLVEQEMCVEVVITELSQPELLAISQCRLTVERDGAVIVTAAPHTSVGWWLW